MPDLTPAQLATLRTELDTDPAALGYTGKTAVEQAALLNAVRSATPDTISDRRIIPAWEVIGATVPSEWLGLSAAEKERYAVLTGAGDVDASNANVTAAFLAMFGAGTTTRTNLQNLVKRNVTRVEKVFNGAVQSVEAWDVARARAL